MATNNCIAVNLHSENIIYTDCVWIVLRFTFLITLLSMILIIENTHCFENY